MQTIAQRSHAIKQAPDTTWSGTVRTVAARVRTTFPALGDTIDRATALVLGGAVAPDAAAGPLAFTVASACKAFTYYDIRCGTPATCNCEDYERHATHEALYHCEHIVAVWIYRRTLAASAFVAPASAACPEALFSITLKGTMDGNEVLLTARGQSREEFRANVAELRGLLDPPAQPAEGWCGKHAVQMKFNGGKDDGKGWWSHRQGDGTWCKGK